MVDAADTMDREEGERLLARLEAVSVSGCYPTRCMERIQRRN